MSNKKIELYIENLTVSGINAGDKQQINAAVQKELTRLLVERGITCPVAQDTNISQLTGQTLMIQPGNNSISIGEKIARAAYGSLVK